MWWAMLAVALGFQGDFPSLDALQSIPVRKGCKEKSLGWVPPGLSGRGKEKEGNGSPELLLWLLEK